MDPLIAIYSWSLIWYAFHEVVITPWLQPHLNRYPILLCHFDKPLHQRSLLLHRGPRIKDDLRQTWQSLDDLFKKVCSKVGKEIFANPETLEDIMRWINLHKHSHSPDIPHLLEP